MDDITPSASLYPAMALLKYMQAPTVGFYYLGASAFGLCILQKRKSITHKRRSSIRILVSTLLLAYTTEVLYYFSRSIREREYEPPKPAAIRCLGSILICIPFTSLIWKSDSLQWHPYFGAFLLQFAFETTSCLVASFSDRQKDVLFAIACIRAAASLLLMMVGFAVLIAKHGETSTDEERRSLLSELRDGSTQENGNSTNGAIAQEASSDGRAGPIDRKKKIRDQQAKRLEEVGGWFGYLKSFKALLPYLFPRNDSQIMMWFVVRFVHMVQKRVFNLLAPRQLGIITDKLRAPDAIMPWKNIGLWVLFSCINSYALGFVDAWANLVISNSANSKITLLAYQHVLSLSMDFHASKESGEVLKALEQGSSSPNALIQMVLFDIYPTVLDIGVSMYYITYLFDAYMTFIILFMGAGYVTIGWWSTTLSQPKRRDHMEKQRAASSTVNEIIRNWETVMNCDRLGFELERYNSNIVSIVRSQYSYSFREMGGRAAQDLLRTLGFTVASISGMSQIMSGRQPLGNLVTLIMYWHKAMAPSYVLSSSYQRITENRIGAERLRELLHTKPDVLDQAGAKDLVIHSGEVEFKDVDFHYDERKSILQGVNLKAGSGQTIAFVGETGGGKSTMYGLLFRFYDVTGGSITVDGQDLRSVTQSSLRDALGVVPQDPVLFNRTIRQNIRYAKLEATDAEIEEACRAAVVHDDIVGFPDGYNSKVGERGVRLSGGQLQRIAIARVLLKNPRIVLLDEATSAIDTAIEARIQKALRTLSQGRTTFVIAHRLSTIVEADQIIVIEKGRIIERGTHQELLNTLGGKYQELWSKQTVGHTHSAKMET